MKAIRRLLPIALLVTLAGCSSFTTQDIPEGKLSNYHQFFVKSNFDDNHGLSGRIANVLKERGFEADKGPLTLMPQSAPAVVTYKDHWAWDFRTHLVGLDIIITDTRSDKVIASGTFKGPVSMITSPDDVIDQLVEKIFKPKSAKDSKPGAALPQFPP